MKKTEVKRLEYHYATFNKLWKKLMSRIYEYNLIANIFSRFHRWHRWDDNGKNFALSEEKLPSSILFDFTKLFRGSFQRDDYITGRNSMLYCHTYNTSLLVAWVKMLSDLVKGADVDVLNTDGVESCHDGVESYRYVRIPLHRCLRRQLKYYLSFLLSLPLPPFQFSRYSNCTRGLLWSP